MKTIRHLKRRLRKRYKRIKKKSGNFYIFSQRTCARKNCPYKWKMALQPKVNLSPSAISIRGMAEPFSYIDPYSDADRYVHFAR